MIDKNFLTRALFLLSLAFISHFFLNMFFQDASYVLRIIAFLPSIISLIVVFWFYQNRNQIARILESLDSKRGLKNLVSEINKTGVLDYRRVAIVLLILTIGIEIETIYSFDLEVFTVASNTLINLTYLVYISLIFYPRPDDIDL